MSDELRGEVRQGLQEYPGARLTGVLRQLDAAASSWYHQPVSAERRKRPGPAPRPLRRRKRRPSSGWRRPILGTAISGSR